MGLLGQSVGQGYTVNKYYFVQVDILTNWKGPGLPQTLCAELTNSLLYCGSDSMQFQNRASCFTADNFCVNASS